MKRLQPAMKKSLSLLALSAVMAAGTVHAAPETAVPIAAPQAAPAVSAAAQEAVSISVNGEALTERGYRPAGAEAMIPLRAVAEALGYTLVWHQESLSVDLNKQAVFTTVKAGEDRYAVNKMYVTLGAKSALVNNKLYVPASFADKVLHGSVSSQGSEVFVFSDKPKTAQTKGVITGIRVNGDYASVQIQGVVTEGVVLKTDKDTVVQTTYGDKLTIADLKIGLTIEAEHSLAATLSLPPQTGAFRITVLDAKRPKELLGTAGVIEEIRTADNGAQSIRIKGSKLTDASQEEIVLQLGDKPALVDGSGEPLPASALVKGAKVIGFYEPAMTRSLPPIGKAWKLVLSVTKE